MADASLKFAPFGRQVPQKPRDWSASGYTAVGRMPPN